MPLMLEVLSVCQAADADEGVGCIVIKGSEKAFAAGADIREMSDKTFEHMYGVNPFGQWDKVGETRTPMIASVSGYALGGGCELAMMCDIIIASTTAQFGQPEISLGVISRRRWHTAADKGAGQGQVDGNVSDRTLHGRRRSRALGFGGARG